MRCSSSASRADVLKHIPPFCFDLVANDFLVLAGAPELLERLADASYKLGDLLAAEKQQDRNRDNDDFGCSYSRHVHSPPFFFKWIIDPNPRLSWLFGFLFWRPLILCRLVLCRV